MTTTTFDTLGYFEKLKAAGIPEGQAEAITKAQAEAMKDFVASRELATKNDLLDLKHEILKWVVGVAIAQSALIVAVMAMLR
jgi:hypothetical protein